MVSPFTAHEDNETRRESPVCLYRSLVIRPHSGSPKCGFHGSKKNHGREATSCQFGYKGCSTGKGTKLQYSLKFSKQGQLSQVAKEDKPDADEGCDHVARRSGSQVGRRRLRT